MPWINQNICDGCGLCMGIPRPSGGSDALSQEASIMLNYALSPNFNLVAFYSHVWGEGVVKNVYEDENEADYVSMEIQFRF